MLPCRAFLKHLLLAGWMTATTAAQLHYELTILGFPCGQITLEQPSPGRLIFTTYSTGLINYLWPFHNRYDTHYDTLTFGVRRYEKDIRQGTFRQQLAAEWDSLEHGLRYDGTIVECPPGCQTVFTLLALARSRPAVELDGRWFPLEHEGQRFRARFLWADTARLDIGGERHLCDHYRIDLVPVDDSQKILAHSDYYSQNVTAEKAVRELWVERSGSRRIVKARVKLYGIPVEARLKDE
jgi:hypothetical protein